MSIRNIGIGLFAAAVLLSSCKEEKDPSYVWGRFEYRADTLADDWEVNGTLAEGGENYWGYCRLDDEGFSFAVGNDSPSQLSSSAFYYEVNGISGSPKSGVYDSEGEIPNEENNYKSFDSMRVKNFHNWEIESGDIPDDTCYVSLFAEAGEEEVTPDDYDSAPFQYFVDIKCTDLDVQSDKDDTIREVFLRVWFDNCSS